MSDNGDVTAADPRAAGASAATSALLTPATAAEAVRRRLGEELPVFCERCGYSLHGLPQTRCAACAVLHFSCPECGHHQPINTLRPAVTRVLGRLRALGVAMILFLKINFFFWVLFGFGGMATEVAYSYNYYSQGTSGQYTYTKTVRPFNRELASVLFVMATLFGMVARMLLLRWPRGVLVGAALAGLVILAMVLGAEFEHNLYHEPLPSPYGFGFLATVLFAAVGVFLGAVVVWGVWLALAHAFLPRPVAASLIAWQRAMSEDKPAGPTNPDAAMSVTS